MLIVVIPFLIFGAMELITANVWEISSGTTFNHVVYGVLPLNQYLQPDNYSDNLTVSLKNISKKYLNN